MNNIEIIESNYPSNKGNYNAFQLKLPLEIFTVIPVDDSVTSFVEIMKGIDTRKYFNCSHRGNKGYDPHMMLQVVLFAFMNGHFTLREMEELCKYDIRYMWLCHDETPSFMAFQRFISEKLTYSIKDIFYDITKRIVELDHVDTSQLYIDGTKIEANAKKNSFVWKKAILGYQSKCFIKITEMIHELNDEFQLNYKTYSHYKSQYIGEITEMLMSTMVKENIKLAYGIGHRKSSVQKLYDRFLDMYLKLVRYEESLEICGDRNSYSKTDHDATMMNMKYDYYNQTGVFKPGYNLQIGVSDSYIMHLGIYSNPTDTKTYIPFMKEYKEKYGFYPKWPIGDAGYGSYDNLLFNVINGMELGLKYNYYAKKHESQFKKKKYVTLNWPTNEKGYKICPNGQVFDQEIKDQYREDGEYLQISRILECGKCSECAMKTECTKSKGNRKITVNYALNELQEKVDQNLGTDEGKEMRRQRSIQAEGTFGVIKQDLRYTRLYRRGKENVEVELFLICLGFNLMKYHNKKVNKRKELVT